MARAFPLAGLLRLRRMQEEQAAADLARANAARAAADRRRADTQRVLADSSLPDAGDALTWRAAVAARASLTSLALESQAALDHRRVAAEAAGEDWSTARAVARALEILEERHTVARRHEEARAEQLVLDEAAARRASTPSGPTTQGELP